MKIHGYSLTKNSKKTIRLSLAQDVKVKVDHHVLIFTNNNDWSGHVVLSLRAQLTLCTILPHLSHGSAMLRWESVGEGKF